MTAKFALGQVVVTPGALDILLPGELVRLLARHQSGDWGDLCREDKEQNDVAVGVGNRILSSYKSKSDCTVWIITEWDRSCTTVLLPDEY